MNRAKPEIDLRDQSDPSRLHPLAPFKVLSFMCYPADVAGRERFFGAIQRETGVTPRLGGLTRKDFGTALEQHCGRGGQAGQLLLTMIQLHHNGVLPSQRLAMELQRTLLPRWDCFTTSRRTENTWQQHLPSSPRIERRNFKNYQAVAHLWAAFIYGEQVRLAEPCGASPVSEPIFPGSNESLPRFLGYAEEFSALFAALPFMPGAKRPLIDPKTRCRFRIPVHLIRHPTVAAMPLPEQWQGIIARYNSLNS